MSSLNARVVSRALIAVCVANVYASATAQAADDPPAASRWTRTEAAHLLRRAAFGGVPSQISQFTRMGRQKAVDTLVDYEAIPQTDAPYPADAWIDRPPLAQAAQLSEDQRQDLRRLVSRVGAETQETLRDWWLHRMMVTPRPLEEKMTLFWHGLLTSGAKEVKNPRWMYEQNEFLRRNALGNFRAILRGISRDSAMLAYLDNRSNVKGHPNENYARELLELFTLGEGNYGEQDVKEAARAFTGWTSGPNGFYVRSRQHDNGSKTFLGKTGNFDGDDIIDIILAQPAAPRHLARRLWVFFVSSEPTDEQVETVAHTLRTTDYNLRETMRFLLASDAFYDPKVRFSLVKSPAELLVGTARLLELPAHDVRALNTAMTQMGQQLFQPPNVKGWDGGRTWINASTLFARYNAMAGLIYGTSGDRTRNAGLQRLENRIDRMAVGPATATMPAEVRAWLADLQMPPKITQAQPAYNPEPLLKGENLLTPSQIVDAYVRRLLQRDLSSARRQVLAAALRAKDQPWRPGDPTNIDRVRGLVHLILSMPEYQLQ